MASTQAVMAAASAARLTSRAALHAALRARDFKDLALWAALVRFDVLQAAAAADSAAALDGWRAISRLVDSAVVSDRDAWKAAPALYLSVTLDQTRALLRAGAVGDAKRTLGTLRSVPAAKFSWEFFKLLAIIECRQGALAPLLAPHCLFSSSAAPHPPASPPTPLTRRRDGLHPPRARHGAGHPLGAARVRPHGRVDQGRRRPRAHLCAHPRRGLFLLAAARHARARGGHWRRHGERAGGGSEQRGSGAATAAAASAAAAAPPAAARGSRSSARARSSQPQASHGHC